MSLIRRALPACLLLLCPLRLVAEDAKAKTFDQFWPETDVFVKLNDNARFFFLWAGTRTESGGYTDGQAGAHIDLLIRPIFAQRRGISHADAAKKKLLTLRIGYLYGKTPADSSDPFVEHTPTTEINARFYVKRKILLTNRNRFDFRFVNREFTPRYRNRLKIEGTIPIKRFNLTPYAHAEAFYDWRYDSFHRFRYAVGAELELTRHIVLESYYLRQVDARSGPKVQNVAGLSAQFYFR